MDLPFYEKIRRLTIIALFSDDDLMDKLVLKGGNALDIVYQIATRASWDLDFSIEDEFEKDELIALKEKIERVLRHTFLQENYVVFDVTFSEKPRLISDEMKDFWGGYVIEFKIIDSEKYGDLKNNIRSLRSQALPIGPGEKRKVKIEISKFEYCMGKKERDIDGYAIYVYGPEMIVFEKLRAICQQMPEYSEIVISPSRSARARDFYDIYTVLENFQVDFKKADNKELLRCIFQAKKVPLELLGKINQYREYHREDFIAVENTVKQRDKLKDFDFYFDYVLEIISELKTFWKE